MTMAHILTPMAMQKQMIVGMMAVLSSPAIASTIARMAVMKRPETAVPIVYLETTSAERQLIMAYMTTSFILPPIPIMNEHPNNRMKPSQVWSRTIEITSIPARARLTSMLPKMIRLTYLNLLLSSWKVSPMMMYPTKRGMGRKEQMLYPSNLQAKQSSAASTAFQPSRELMPLRVKIATVLVDYLDYFYIIFIIQPKESITYQVQRIIRRQAMIILRKGFSYGEQQLYKKHSIFKEIPRLTKLISQKFTHERSQSTQIDYQLPVALCFSGGRLTKRKQTLPKAKSEPNAEFLYINLEDYQEKLGREGSRLYPTHLWNQLSLSNQLIYLFRQLWRCIRLHLSAADWKFLKRICLSNNRIGRKGAVQLGKCKWPYLTSLDMSFNRIKNEGLAGLVHGEWPRLTRLELESAQLAGDGMRCLRKAWWARLAILNLWGNEIGSALINELCYCSLHALSNVHIGLGARETVNVSKFSKLVQEHRMTEFHFQPNLDVGLQKSVMNNIANYFQLMEEDNL